MLEKSKAITPLKKEREQKQGNGWQVKMKKSVFKRSLHRDNGQSAASHESGGSTTIRVYLSQTKKDKGIVYSR